MTKDVCTLERLLLDHSVSPEAFVLLQDSSQGYSFPMLFLQERRISVSSMLFFL